MGDGLVLRLDGTPRLEVLLAPMAELRRMCQEGLLPLGGSLSVSRPAALVERRVREELKLVEDSAKTVEGTLKVGVVFP